MHLRFTKGCFGVKSVFSNKGVNIKYTYKTRFVVTSPIICSALVEFCKVDISF